MKQTDSDFLTHSQRVKFIGAIIPAINLFIIPFIAFPAVNKLAVICLGLANPIIGVTFLKLSMRFLGKETILKILPLAINGINIFFICWLAGDKSPSFLIGIPFIGACTLIFSNMRQLIIAIICAMISISSGSYLGGKMLPDICTYLVLLLCYSFVVVRMLHFTILQGREIMLAHQKNEIQRQLLEEKNKNITDSITYAKRIQNSLLPTDKYIDKTLKRLNKK